MCFLYVVAASCFWSYFQYKWLFLALTPLRIFVFLCVVGRFAVGNRIIHYVYSNWTLHSLHGNSVLRLKFPNPSAVRVLFCFVWGTLFFSGFLFLLIFPMFFDLFG